LINLHVILHGAGHPKKFTDEDQSIVDERLTDLRDLLDGLNLSRELTKIKEFKTGIPILETDWHLMELKLEDERDPKSGVHEGVTIIEMPLSMTKLGRKQEYKKDDWRWHRITLKEYRKKDSLPTFCRLHRIIQQVSGQSIMESGDWDFIREGLESLRLDENWPKVGDILVELSMMKSPITSDAGGEMPPVKVLD
jgi:hypothetical protein